MPKCNRTSLAYGNGTAQASTFDAVSRLKSLTVSGLVPSTANFAIDQIGYNPANQITSQRKSDALAWPGYLAAARTYALNNLNQVTQATSSIGPAVTFAYDAKGNLTRSGSDYYCYDAENRLTAAGATSTCGTPSATLAYDPLGRLMEVDGSASTTEFAYDGLNMIAEYDDSGTLQRRYVFGPGMDEPIVQYEGTGLAERYWLHADERGSVVALSDADGNALATNSYDEYGMPATTNAGRFQYTGQAFLPEVGLYYYKARLYSPTLGRFLQADPIGYGDGMNWYAYTHNDPVNAVDPTGTEMRQICHSYLVTIIAGGPGYGSYGGYTTGQREVCDWMDIPDTGVSSPLSVGPGGGNPGGSGGSGGTQPATAPQKAKKPAYCANPNYRRGKDLKNAGNVAKFLGVETLLVGAGEAAYYGSMTEGPGAVAAVPTLAKGAEAYSFGSATSAAGSILQCNAGSNAACNDVVANGVLGAISAAAGPADIAHTIADIVADQIVGAANEVDPCE